MNEWILEKLEETGWSQRELGRRAGLSSGQVSNVVNGNRTATWDFCAAVARAFGERPEKAFRIAGLLKVSPDGSDLKEDELELLEVYRHLKTDRAKRLFRRALIAILEDEQEHQDNG